MLVYIWDKDATVVFSIESIDGATSWLPTDFLLNILFVYF